MKSCAVFRITTRHYRRKRAFLLDVRTEILLDEDHAGRARLRGDLERPGGRWTEHQRHHRGRDGADERQVQGDGRGGVSGCGEGEGEQSGVVRGVTVFLVLNNCTGS
jgi:hypothetical protein